MNGEPKLDLRSLIQRFAKQGNELDRLAELANKPGYWISLNPGMTIGPTSPLRWDPDEESEFRDVDEALTTYRNYGFCSLSRALSITAVDKMRLAIERLRAADWPPVFSFIYDDFWLIARAAKLHRLLNEILGNQFRLLTRVWTHYVEAASGSGGWTPHLDHPDEEGRTISLWIPLGPATLRNGCMYLVKRTPKTDEICKGFHRTSSMSTADISALLKQVRALPSESGTVLCWDEKILHWGSQYEGGNEPRVSIALEFTVPNFGLAGQVERLVDPLAPLPSFESRLQWICWAVLSYRRFEPMIERYSSLAERIYRRSQGQLEDSQQTAG